MTEEPQHASGHREAPAADAADSIPARPHMEDAGIERLEFLMRTSRVYMEFGSGGSTMLAGQIGIPLIVSTESDGDYCRKVGRQFCPAYLKSLLVSLHANVGPTQSWGYPSEDSTARRWPLYATTAWKFVEHIGRGPDLILIDGRFRSACMLVSLSCGKPGTTILFDDYIGRDYRHIVERFIQPRQYHGRMAEFVIPAALDFPHARLALSLAQTLTDPA